MVIWRGIYLVGPLAPSTHLLHTPLQREDKPTDWFPNYIKQYKPNEREDTCENL